jgi:hypothetical protein
MGMAAGWLAGFEIRETQDAGMVLSGVGRASRWDGQQKVCWAEMLVRKACTAMKLSGQESPGASVDEMSVSIFVVITGR